MTILLTFYVVGGAVGILMNLRFMLPMAYYDLRNSWGVLGFVKTFGYQFIRVLLFSCVAFFVSWISVGYFLINYQEFKEGMENIR